MSSQQEHTVLLPILQLQEVLPMNVLLALMGRDKGRVRYEIR